MIVDVASDHVNMSKVFTLNETAACLWQKLCEGDFSTEELAEWLCGEYEVEMDTAHKDVERQLAEWKNEGLVRE